MDGGKMYLNPHPSLRDIHESFWFHKDIGTIWLYDPFQINIWTFTAFHLAK